MYLRIVIFCSIETNSGTVNIEIQLPAYFSKFLSGSPINDPFFKYIQYMEKNTNPINLNLKYPDNTTVINYGPNIDLSVYKSSYNYKSNLYLNYNIYNSVFNYFNYYRYGNVNIKYKVQDNLFWSINLDHSVHSHQNFLFQILRIKDTNQQQENY